MSSSQFYVGVTDNQWFSFLAERHPPEVNFWSPSGVPLARLKPGMLFLFKLHSPLNVIAGGGFFVRFMGLPLSVAWNTFQDENGAQDYLSFRRMIFEKRQDADTIDPVIGCLILAEPFFLAEADWISQPCDWGKSTVRGKYYSLDEPVGRGVWQAVQAELRKQPITEGKSPSAIENLRYGSPELVYPRLGQGAFRAVVTDAYSRCCAITGERTLPALTASHIKPYAASGPHDVRNGLLLRADVHMLFDSGYLTVTTDYRVEVSRRIKEEFDNGRQYYAFHGYQIRLPENQVEYPAANFIEWHNNEVYRP